MVHTLNAPGDIFKGIDALFRSRNSLLGQPSFLHLPVLFSIYLALICSAEKLHHSERPIMDGGGLQGWFQPASRSYAIFL
uniref:Uncharacterized protein n=1 Tax=Picea glauca TaxID=3330 RepID=A0A101M1V7_PICGL|nr:hypothetical protein ABT39_MTgene3931 [Picea glauca]QHR91046.1 hypothetical protein Q903MT_gene5078 [Picea sitchensis]